MMKPVLILAFLFSVVFLTAQPVFVAVRKSLNNNDFRRCVVLLDSCLRKNYGEDSALFYKALVHIKTNEFRAARKTATALFKRYPDFKERHYLNGLIYFSEENYGKCIDEFNSALRADPKNVKIIYNRSIAFGLLEEYLAAIEDLGVCIEIDPAYAQAYYSRAYWYEYTGNYREALKDYETNILLAPDNYDAYLGLANTCKNLGEMTKACEAINKAIIAGSLAAAELKVEFCK